MYAHPGSSLGQTEPVVSPEAFEQASKMQRSGVRLILVAIQ